MKLIETYSGNTGLKINRPFILTKFYPTPEKYITTNISSHMSSKQYNLWQVVIDNILPVLKSNNIEIIQLGNKEEPQLNGTIYLNGQTDIQQSCYIVKNALLHLGADSFLVHAADAFNTPICALYGPCPPGNCGPTFGDKIKQICLEPTFPDKQSYSYNPNETPAMINTIKPELIVESVGKLLNINFPKFNTLFTGNRFQTPVLECIPNVVVPINFFQGHVLNIRLDYLDETSLNHIQFIAANLQTRPCGMVIDKSFAFAPLIQFKNNIHMVILDFSKWDDENLINNLIENHIKFAMICDAPDDRLKSLKLKYCEYGVVQKFKRCNEELKGILSNIDKNNCYIKTNRVICSGNNVYLSKLALTQNKNSTGLEQGLSELENIEELANEADFLYVYGK